MAIADTSSRSLAGSSRGVLRASKTEKTCGFLTFIFYITLGYYLSRHRIPVLDDFTDHLLLKRSSLFSTSEGEVGFAASTQYPDWVSAAVSCLPEAVSEFFSTLHGSAALLVIKFSSAIDTGVGYLAENYSHFYLATVWTIIVHQTVYWTLSLPSFLFQFLPFMTRWKIQDRDCPLSLQWTCFKHVTFNQLFVECPLYLLNYVFCTVMNFSWTAGELPTWYQVAGSLLGSLAIEDAWHFFSHWLMHINTKAYQKIHKQHHQFVTPTGMQAEYAHPVEVLTLGVGFILGCSIFCTHFFVTWLWMAVRLLETIEVHGGYDVPLYGNWLHVLPFYGGARFHDFHHSNFVGNYSSTFTYWDAIFDTDMQFREFTRKRKEKELKQL